MKQTSKLILILCLVVSPLTALSQVLLSGSKSTTDSSGSSTSSTATSSGGLGGSSYVPSQSISPTVSKTDAMLTNAQNAKDKQDNGKQMAMIAAGVMGATAAATCPACTKRGTCPICYGALIGAAASLLTAGQMGKASDQSKQQAYDVNPLDMANSSSQNQTKVEDTPAYQNAQKQISSAAKAAGASVSSDLKSLNTADGRNISIPQAMSSGAGASGLTASEQAALATNLKSGQDAIAQKTGADGTKASGDILEEYAGGGSRGGFGKAASDDPAVVAAQAKADARKPSSVEGAFKEYNGEKIGVAMDSMFEMMHRRYKHHAEERQSFIRTQQ